MCNKRNSKWITIDGRRFRVDSCIRNLIDNLNDRGIETIGCCCGHNKYPITIIHRRGEDIFDFCTGTLIPRKRNFYKKDEKGIFFLPEVKR